MTPVIYSDLLFYIMYLSDYNEKLNLDVIYIGYLMRVE